MKTRRTSIYLYPDDLDRLEVLKVNFGLGTSSACRAGIALLLAHLKDGDRQDALDETVGPIRRKEKEMEKFAEVWEWPVKYGGEWEELEPRLT